MIKSLIERLWWSHRSTSMSVEPSDKPFWEKKLASTPEEIADMLERKRPTEKGRDIALKLIATRDPKESAKLAKQLVPGIKISKKNAPPVLSKKERAIAAGATKEEAQDIFSKYIRRRP